MLIPTLPRPQTNGNDNNNKIEKAGCDDGAVVVWDADTRGAARALRPNSAPVSALAWSRCGRLVASGAGDRSVALSLVGGAFRSWSRSSSSSASSSSCLPAAVLGRSPDLGGTPTQLSFLSVREEETGFFPVAESGGGGGGNGNSGGGGGGGGMAVHVGMGACRGRGRP